MLRESFKSRFCGQRLGDILDFGPRLEGTRAGRLRA